MSSIKSATIVNSVMWASTGLAVTAAVLKTGSYTPLIAFLFPAIFGYTAKEGRL